MKRIVLGILAHVDAGKTTLSEGLLYSSGAISKIGRVDRGDTALDTHEIERARGITVFSAQATATFGETAVTIVDTPGHIDFSAEAERAITVQDYAVLIISAPDGVTAHTKTLWQMLSARSVPTFIFVNKIDISARRRGQILDEIRTVLSPAAVDFTKEDEEFYESAASRSEALIDEYFATDTLKRESIARAIAKRQIFPTVFGSALKMTGISELISLIDRYTLERSYSKSLFGGRIYKISRDDKNRRLTFMKITGGEIFPKDTLTLRTRGGEEYEEKIEELRIYSGNRYKTVKSAEGGEVVALLGPIKTAVGDGAGFESPSDGGIEPVLDYRLILGEGQNPYEAYLKLSVLSEEEPALSLCYDERRREIRVKLMGEIQMEVLTRIILDRFGYEVSFDEGRILYKETVADTVYGFGHFEPLRHYAEVHLRIEPLPAGSGIIADTECDTDSLSLNWQRLVMTHIEERAHRGVLTGSPLTDVKITQVAGRAHLKHTEGGDFRQATYRAIRQGLMKAHSILLEPTFDFKAELPEWALGRFMNDITNMHGTLGAPEFSGDTVTIEGNCPVATVRSYAKEIRAYTQGEGRISMRVGPYKPCHNTDEVIASFAYDPLTDERNTPSSVFCKAGAGYNVPWDEVEDNLHIETPNSRKRVAEDSGDAITVSKARGDVDEGELMRIFEATYGKIKPRVVPDRVVNSAPTETKAPKPKKQKMRGESYVIIDGYNFIFANESLRSLAERDISAARDALVRLMCDYTAFTKSRAVVVFDAYKRRGGEGSVEEYGAVTVVYTKEAETADSFIEKTTYDMSGEHTVRVVTADMQEQLVILGAGGLRVGAVEFMRELSDTAFRIRETIETFSK
ncbi:MAG: TetM/TetW/TetO/TetS family tetracycline resistance ribosomal protection protein [Clostridia bacterium]|nr:TetM/TetW/TetO/TetS family tetracycline resistance ribosomal protection protein [Clostridia bacterium]